MNKDKLYIFLSVLTIVFFITTSAVCTQCATKEESPTIKLQIYDGPNYSESDNMCYYRVEAVVTGTPEPEIVFDTDDNVEDIGTGRVEVGVEAGDLYTLNATATNTAGTAIVSIELDGTCGEDTETAEEEATEEETATKEDTTEESTGNGEAVEPTINLAVSQDATYSADDDVCYYMIEATVTGNPSPHITWSEDESNSSWGNKIAQVNLNRGETYTLTATAANSAGSATDTITLTWGCDGDGDGDGEVEIATIYADPDISGYIYFYDDNWRLDHRSYITMGDTPEDTQMKGYFSFDISGLHGKIVQNAEINFTNIEIWGDDLGASAIVVDVFNYVRIDFTDFIRTDGVHLVDIPISDTSYTISGNTLKNELQNVLNNEVRDYFQLRLCLDVATDEDELGDYVVIYCEDAILTINYTD